MPTGRHQLPAVGVESRQTFRSESFTHGRPELFLVLASVERSGQLRIVGTNVPEQDAKGVNVYRVIIGTTEKFRSHVNRSADNCTRHHRLGLTESQVSEAASIGVVKLRENKKGEYVIIIVCEASEYTLNNWASKTSPK